jgi:hypothetical protein
MKRAAKGFRFVGRVLLAAGTILVAGAIAMMIYSLFGGWEGSSVTPPPGFVPGDPSAPVGVRTSGLIWTVLLMILALVGLAFTFKRLNAFMRKTIKQIAGFVHANIFLTELALTGLVWLAASMILLFVLPVAAILTAVFLVINQLCFVLAWLCYGRKKYKL